MNKAKDLLDCFSLLSDDVSYKTRQWSLFIICVVSFSIKSVILEKYKLLMSARTFGFGVLQIVIIFIQSVSRVYIPRWSTPEGFIVH